MGEKEREGEKNAEKKGKKVRSRSEKNFQCTFDTSASCKHVFSPVKENSLPISAFYNVMCCEITRIETFFSLSSKLP